MEDVLDVYARPYNPQRPRCALTSRQTTGGRDLHPIPATPGRPRATTTSTRRGVANVFMIFEPLAGERHVR